MGRKNNKVRARVIPPEAPSVRPAKKILGAPMTREEYVRLAQEVAHQEIASVAQKLAAQVHQGVQHSMEPLSKRLSDIYYKINIFEIHLHALVELLVEKGVFDEKEFEAAFKRVHDQFVAKQEEMKKAFLEKQAAEKAKAEAKTTPGEAEAEGGDGGESSGAE